MANTTLSAVQGTIYANTPFVPATNVVAGTFGVVPSEPINASSDYRVITNQAIPFQTVAQVKAAMNTTTLARAVLNNATAFSVPNNVITTVNSGWTIVNDTTGATTTAGTFTCPRTAYYMVSSSLVFSTTAAAISTSYQVIIAKNGVSVLRSLQQVEDGVTNTVRPTGSVSGIVSCVAGDILTIQSFQNRGSSQTLGGALPDNYFTIAELINNF